MSAGRWRLRQNQEEIVEISSKDTNRNDAYASRLDTEEVGSLSVRMHLSTHLQRRETKRKKLKEQTVQELEDSRDAIMCVMGTPEGEKGTEGILEMAMTEYSQGNVTPNRSRQLRGHQAG